eukprot:1159491-Pelagomonas_calceolata.AAC.5
MGGGPVSLDGTWAVPQRSQAGRPPQTAHTCKMRILQMGGGPVSLGGVRGGQSRPEIERSDKEYELCADPVQVCL